MDETKEIEFDLRKILYMMKSKIIYILLATLLLGTVSGCFTHFFIDPIYSATTKMFVYSNTDRVSTSASVSPNDILGAKELINTYVYVLQSDTVLEKVIADLSLNTNADTLRDMVSANVVPDTQAFQVTVKTKDPYLSANIANSIAKVAPDEIVRVVKAGGVEIIDKAKPPKNPSSPNIQKNILIGALLGFIVSFLGFLIYELFDSTIVNAKDLEREFEIPILGTIPRLETSRYDSEPDDDDKMFTSSIGKPSDDLIKSIKAVKGGAKND